MVRSNPHSSETGRLDEGGGGNRKLMIARMLLEKVYVHKFSINVLGVKEEIMDSRVFKVFGVLAALLLVSSFFVGSARAVDWKPASTLQGIFDNPEGSVVVNRNTVLVSNAAAVDGFFQFEVGAGYISKLKIDGKGRLHVVDPVFVEGLTRPLGMAVLPKKVGRIKKRTVFVGVGGTWLWGKTDANELQSGIVAFNPNNGKILGIIHTSIGSAFEVVTGGPVLAINALAFDSEGNLYFTDTGIGYDKFPDSDPMYDPMFPYQGVWKVDASRLEGLLEPYPSVQATVPIDTEGLAFCGIEGGPDGIEFSPDGDLFVNTVGLAATGLEGDGRTLLDDTLEGAIYQLTEDDFVDGSVTSIPTSEALYIGLGALDGLVFTSDGTMLCTEIISGDIIAIVLGSDPEYLEVPDLNGPADISVAVLGGKTFVIIPEHTSGVPLPDAIPKEDDRVTVIQLKGVK